MVYENLSVEKIFDELNSSKKGLAESEIEKRLIKHGYNQLKEKRKISPLKIFLSQFSNFIVYVLLAAAIISLFIDEIINFWVISFIIIFIIILGFIQEYKAERVIEALKKMVQPATRVLRDGKLREIPIREVVPGDVLLLETGDIIPAEAKIFEIIGLKVDEAALTGESVAIEKKKDDLVFTGTLVVNGKCKALVIATGMETRLGKIADMVEKGEDKTPLQKKIDQLAKTLAIIALAACTLTFFLGLIKGAAVGEILIVALALAVAAVPEGLPLTLTLTFSDGMRRMAKHNVVVRKMLGVETLGSTTVICTDKTGTLTKNEMTIERIFVDDKLFDVTGAGYEKKGDFFVNGKKINVEKEKDLKFLLEASFLCSNAALEEKEGKIKVVGDPIEAAVAIAASKADLFEDDLEKYYPRLDEIIFTSERKLMTTIHQNGQEKIAFTKGAPEVILEKCKFIRRKGKAEKITDADLSNIFKTNKNLADSAYRVIGVAYKKFSQRLASGDIENDLVFIGLAAMIDPPRNGVEDAIEKCKKAGIKIVMITGDNEQTAKAVAKKIGLLNNEKIEFDELENEKLQRIVEDGAITGSELEKLSDEEFEKIVDDICIYARVMPEQKYRIVEALKKNGHIVAMTGDGVNDAPALKKADIGVAMGIKGTDVAKESSTMVLQDDNFASIVEAVRRGRTIYDNIEKFTTYLISRNFTEVILIIMGLLLLGFELIPLLALQIIFINTFDEIIPAIALGLDPPREGVMNKKPRNPKEKILKKQNLILIFSVALYMAVSSFLVFILDDPVSYLEKARTLTFATIISMILFVPFAFRSLEEPIYKLNILTNKLLILSPVIIFSLTVSVMYIPFFQDIFELSTLSVTDWIIPISVAFSALIFTEIMKATIKRTSDYTPVDAR